MNFIGTTPLLGTWLRRRDAKTIICDVQDGDRTAITELCNLVCDSTDSRARDIAAAALAGLRDPGAIREFIEEVLARNDLALNRIVSRHFLSPDDKEISALFFFVTGDTERYHALDPAPHPLLAGGYSGSGRRVQEAVYRGAKRHNLHVVLARVLHEKATGQESPILTPGEWETLLNGLIEEKRWEELRAFILSAPLPLAVTALLALRGSGWKAAGDDFCVWDVVMRAVPGTWSHPLPGNTPAMTIGPGDGLATRSAFSRDGTLLAIGNCDGSVQVWQVRTGTLISTIQTGKGAPDFIVFSADNGSLICGEDPASCRCREIRSGGILWEYHTRGTMSCPSVSAPDRSFLVIGETAGRLTVLSSGNGRPLNIISGLPAPVTALAVSPDGSSIFVGCADGSISAAPPCGGSVTTILKGRGDPARMVGASADGEKVTVVFDISPPVLMGRDGNILRRFAGHTGRVAAAAIAPDGSSLAIAGAGGAMNIWRHDDSVPVHSLPVNKGRVTACVFTPGGMSLAIGYNDGTVRFIDEGKGGSEWEHRSHRKGVTSLAISPDGTLLLSNGWDRSVRLWDVKTGEPERTLVRETGGVTGIALSGNGNIIAAGYSRGAVNLYRRDTGENVRSLDRYMRTVKAIASNHTGTLLAFAGGDKSLLCWNAADDSVTSCEGLRGPPHCLSFIPGEDLLVSGGWDGKVRLFDMPKGTLLATFPGHTSIITSCTASPDGSIFVTGSNDRTVRIWSRKSRRCMRVIRDSRTEVGAIAFSPDGCYLVAAGSDETIRVYTVPDGTRERNIPGVAGSVTALAFTGDGQILAAGYDTGTLALVSWTERRIIHTIHAHSGPVTGLEILPGGEAVATGGSDGSVRVWRLSLAPDLSGKTMEDIARASLLEHASPPGKDREQWRFLRAVLSARFSSEIELCDELTETGEFDIQIVG